MTYSAMFKVEEIVGYCVIGGSFLSTRQQALALKPSDYEIGENTILPGATGFRVLAPATEKVRSRLHSNAIHE